MFEVDCRGLACPLPLLKLKVALHDRAPEDRLCLHTTDVISMRDIPAFLKTTPHHLQSVETADGVYSFIISVG